MSEATFEGPDLRARQIKACAASWLERREREEWSERDQSELDAWLAQSPAHIVAYLRLEATWDRAARLSVLRTPASEAGQGAPRRNLRSLLASFAAALIIITCAGIAGGLYLTRPVEKTYATGLGGHQTVRLADGSRIELNTNTTLRAIVGAGQRMVWLDHGEAFFRIAHDDKHPFVVAVGDHRVTVLGTEFLVRRDTSRLEVAVMEGRVGFGAADGNAQSRETLLTQGDVATSVANSVSVAKTPLQKLAGEIGWRHGVLVFSHETLASAAAEFNRYNRRKIIVADPSAARMTIDGTFQTDKVDAFTDVAQEVLGLRIEKRGDQAVISR